MSTAVTLNGTSYNIPAVGEDNWGTVVSNYLIALATGVLSKAGGSFTLTADADFGANFGLKSIYYKSRGTTSTAGVVRLANNESVGWRNAANSADLLFKVNTSNVLEFNGAPIPTIALGAADEVLQMNSGGTAYEFAKLNNANVASAAAIAVDKLAALTASRAVVSDASGFLSSATTTATEIGYVNGVTSAIQTQLDAKLNKSGGTMTGDLVLAGDPDSALKAATKQYVDALLNGIKWKASVRVATTAAVTLATDFENGDTIDGVVLATGDRILIKDQAAGAENGIYLVAASGAPSRALDADAFGELNGAAVMVMEGTANANKGFMQTAELTALSDAQTWTQNFGTGLYAASGEGIELSGSTFSLELDGTTLSKSASGVKVNEIANTQIAAAAAIAVNKLAALTASRAVVSDASGFLTQATTTATEIGYVNGVTSAIQTQLDAKFLSSNVIDEDSFASDLDTKVPTQQSTKAYVDNAITAVTGAADSATDYWNGSLAASVAASALTIALKNKAGSDASGGSPVKIGFRNATATTGTYNVRSVTGALSVVVSSGSTLGHADGHNDYIYVYAIDNAGTVELAVSSTIYDDGSIVTTTAEGGAGASDSLTAIYSTTARTDVPLRLIGRLKSNQATAGTYATAIAEISNIPFSDNLTYPPSMTDVIATKLGHKIYAHGTTYRAGIAPTITPSAGVGTIQDSYFIPYQMSDGSWRLRFNFRLSSTANFASVTVNGVTFKNSTNFRQSVSVLDIPSTLARGGYASNNTSTIVVHSSAAADEHSASGDVQLESKPTWAY